jgi:GH35 family endo-1,4-beta-xylanase
MLDSRFHPQDSSDSSAAESSNTYLNPANAGANRREWLRQAAALGVASTTLYGATGPLTVRAFEPGGAPCDGRFLDTLLLTDKNGDPYEVIPQKKEAGTATIELPKGKFELTMVLPVKDFGTVYLFADDGGELYAPTGRELLLNYEFARCRAAFVRRYLKAAQAAGITFSDALLTKLARGEALLKQASEARETPARAEYSNQSLSETMWAGEMAALERARFRISHQGPRPGFLFGAYSHPFAKTEEHFKLFTDLFNEMTLALYRRGTDTPYFRPGVEREEGKADYSLADSILQKVAGTDITIKGHPLMWFGRPGVPEFLRTKTWDGVKQSCRQYILQTVSRFKSRIHLWDSINEAHDSANELGYNHAQLLELTRFACEMTRVADPTAFRVVNATSPWGEYAQKRRAQGGGKTWTPLAYYRAVEEARVPYEAIGLQVYNPKRDMLEIERQMERFFVFGKPVHITELGISSSSEPDKRSQMIPSPEVWHGTAWNEQIQADWVEQYYTICYSKPEINAIIWWNFTDPSLFPNAAFLTDDLRPKESYHRLLKLVRTWRGA